MVQKTTFYNVRVVVFICYARGGGGGGHVSALVALITPHIRMSARNVEAAGGKVY
jgi:hypothetical protein